MGWVGADLDLRQVLPDGECAFADVLLPNAEAV